MQVYLWLKYLRSPTCCVCVWKNIRHSKTNNSSFGVNYPPKSELRKAIKCKQLKSRLSIQQAFCTSRINKNKNAAIASFKISHSLAKQIKPFLEREQIKEAFLVRADSLFEWFSNKRKFQQYKMDRY